MSTTEKPRHWTDLPAGESRVEYGGETYTVIRPERRAYANPNDTEGWTFPGSAWRVQGRRGRLIFRVVRGAEFWAGPECEWNVPDDIAETFRIVNQGGYDPA